MSSNKYTWSVHDYFVDEIVMDTASKPSINQSKRFDGACTGVIHSLTTAVGISYFQYVCAMYQMHNP